MLDMKGDEKMFVELVRMETSQFMEQQTDNNLSLKEHE